MEKKKENCDDTYKYQSRSELPYGDIIPKDFVGDQIHDMSK